MTKSDFAVFQERIETRFERAENRFVQSQLHIQSQIKESEFRLITKLGFLTVSTVSIAVTLLTWLIQI